MRRPDELFLRHTCGIAFTAHDSPISFARLSRRSAISLAPCPCPQVPCSPSCSWKVSSACCLDHDFSNFVRMFERSKMPRLRQRDLPASVHQLRNLVSLLRLRPIMVPINQRNGDVYPRIEPASRDIARRRTEVTAFHVRKAGSAATSELLGKKVFGELARVKEPTPHHPAKDESILQFGGW